MRTVSEEQREHVQGEEYLVFAVLCACLYYLFTRVVGPSLSEFTFFRPAAAPTPATLQPAATHDHDTTDESNPNKRD